MACIHESADGKHQALRDVHKESNVACTIKQSTIPQMALHAYRDLKKTQGTGSSSSQQPAAPESEPASRRRNTLIATFYILAKN